MLIDFTNDSEDRVWQKAITYLFFILNHLGNKWLRYSKPLKKKLQRLKESKDAQEALKEIISLMQFELQNTSFLDKKIFENEYFKDTPFNYFLPFYKGNSSVDKLYENENIEDIENFVPYLFDLPMPDAAKYLMCNRKDLRIQKVKKNISSNDDTETAGWFEKMHLYRVFEPYLSFVNEFLNFYENFPNIDSNFKQKVSLVSVKNLKNLLLNTVENHRAMARQFSLQNELGNAISHYEQLLKIDKEDVSAMMNLAVCYEKTNKDYKTCLDLRLKIEEIVPKDHYNLNLIGALHFNNEKYKMAIKFFNKALELESNQASYYNNSGDAKYEIKKYEDAIKDYSKAIELDNKNAEYYSNRANSKNELKDDEGALEDLNIAIELDNKKGGYYNNRGISKGLLKYHKEAIEDFKKAIELEKNDATYLHNLASEYRHYGDFTSAHFYIDKAMNIDNKNSKIYGTKGAIFASEGNDEEFYRYFEKALKLEAKAEWLDEDIQEKYKDEERFKELLLKYNQVLE